MIFVNLKYGLKIVSKNIKYLIAQNACKIHPQKNPYHNKPAPLIPLVLREGIHANPPKKN
ncbi:hypothetical protein [Helicobacter sp. T3_23-1059]